LAASVLAIVVKAAKKRKRGQALVSTLSPIKKSLLPPPQPVSRVSFPFFWASHMLFTHTVTPHNTKGQIERCGACGPQVPIFVLRTHTYYAYTNGPFSWYGCFRKRAMPRRR
jgi:hypothetical protein